MISLNKIELKELFTLKQNQFEQYHNVLKYLEPMPLKNIKIKSISDLSFGEVAGLKILLKEPNYNNIVEMFEAVFGTTKKQTHKINVVEFYHALNWIKEEIKAIYENENNNLSAKPNPKLKDAGIDRLNVFEELNTLIAIGEKFSKAPQEVETWNYNLVFSLILHQKISNEIQQAYSEIINQKDDE